jgi:hypothetical protein
MNRGGLMMVSGEQLSLGLFIFSVSLGIGGGLYETRVVYPNWTCDPDPQTLGAKLISSGQARAGRRFWPFVSPASMLLALFNLYLAWQQTGSLRKIWFASAMVIVVKSIATYSYFAPTMMRTLERAEKMDRSILRQTVRIWAALSPFRVIAELFAWTSGIWALILLSKK